MERLDSKVQRYIQQMQARRERRKSPWNLAILAISVVFIAVTWICLGRLATYVHNILHPGQLFSNSEGFGPALTAVSPFFIVLPIGLWLGNWLVHLIRGAREKLDAETVEGDPHSTYNGAQHDLLWFAIFAVPIGAVLLCMGVYLPWNGTWR